jgi:hypothetical protein
MFVLQGLPSLLFLNDAVVRQSERDHIAAALSAMSPEDQKASLEGVKWSVVQQMTDSYPGLAALRALEQQRVAAR